MRTVKPQELSLEAFNKYGHFAQIINPTGASIGPKIHELFFDRLVFSYASPFPVGISVTRILKRPFVIELTEIHRDTGEVLLPLTDDIYCHVGMPSDCDNPDFDTFEIFHVPKGTAIMLNNGVWHHAPYPCNESSADILVLLPERTYAHDCIVVQIPPDKQIKIDLPG
jgi:ureidoglycolate lyase